MKKLLKFLILLELLISLPLLGSEFEQNFLQLCAAVSDDLEEVTSDCVGPCDNKDGAIYKSLDLEAISTKLHVEGTKQVCETKSYKKIKKRSERLSVACRCLTIKKYADKLKDSCKKNNKSIYLVKSPKEELIKKFSREMQTKFHNRYSLYGIYLAASGEKADCWPQIEKEIPKEKRELFFSANQNELERKEENLKSYLDGLLNQESPGAPPSEGTKEMLERDVLAGKTLCERMVSDIQDSLASWDDLQSGKYQLRPAILDTADNKIFRCMSGAFKKKSKQNISLLQPLMFNLELMSSAGLNKVSLMPSIDQAGAVEPGGKASLNVELYTPQGKKITGKNNYDVLVKHRRSWLTHTLEKLVPYMSDLDEQSAYLRQELIAESDPIRRKEILAELDEVNEAKREVEKTLAEAKSFDEVEKPESKVVEQEEDSTPQQNVSSVQSQNSNKEKPRKVSKGFNKGFDVKSIFDTPSKLAAPILPAQQEEESTVNTPQVVPSQKEQAVASKTGAKKSKMKGAKRAPSSIKSSGSNFAGGSKGGSSSGGSFVSSPSVPSTPKYVFVDEEKRGPKVNAMIDRLSDGDVYAFVNPKQKRVKIYKKQQQTQVFMAEKSVAELNKMGVNIDESRLDSISKITFKDKRIFFHYEDGSYQEGNLLDVRSSKELESLF